MSNKSELPELEMRESNTVRIGATDEDDQFNVLAQVLGPICHAMPVAAEIARRCNGWPHIEELVSELKGKCEGMGEYEWNELFEPVFDELKIVLEGEQ